MKKFRLQGLERLRDRALQEKRLALAVAAQACMNERHTVTRLEAQELACLEEATRGIASPGGPLTWALLAETARKGRVRAGERLALSRRAEAEAVAKVVTARQDLRVVERLRERREEEARLEAHRADERQLNDLNAGRYARRTPRERDAA